MKKTTISDFLLAMSVNVQKKNTEKQLSLNKY